MKTFLIVSDSHAHRERLEKLRALVAENDYLVHLGDGMGDIREIAKEFPEKVYSLKGNCDFSVGQEECVIEAERLSILCCHGHKYGVKGGLERLARAARKKGCEIALYGHTHVADIRTVDGVLCINPGALSSFTEPSYCYLVLHNGKPTATIVNL